MLRERVATGAPFVALGAAAIVAGGATAAAIAYHPTEHLVWMVAYLVLVVGVMQWIFGAGEAWLAERPPAGWETWAQWVLFNLGNAGVIGGTLCDRAEVVAAGTLLFVAAIAWFLWGVRHCRRRGWGNAYRVLLALIFVSACVGLAISAASNRQEPWRNRRSTPRLGLRQQLTQPGFVGAGKPLFGFMEIDRIQGRMQHAFRPDPGEYQQHVPVGRFHQGGLPVAALFVVETAHGEGSGKGSTAYTCGTVPFHAIITDPWCSTVGT
ncbi:MAG: hypothetical protein ACREP2_00755 [Rhodanobacteraceae bacterium]